MSEFHIVPFWLIFVTWRLDFYVVFSLGYSLPCLPTVSVYTHYITRKALFSIRYPEFIALKYNFSTNISWFSTLSCTKTGSTQPKLSAACFVVQSCLADADFVVFSDYCLIGTRHSREIFIKGIDHSYYYKGYTTFQTNIQVESTCKADTKTNGDVS